MDRRALDEAGLSFELAVCQRLRLQLKDSIVIHNRSLYSYWLHCSTQIDALLVTDKCVYVIECKNWKNSVKGRMNDKLWTGVASNRHNLSVINIYDQNIIHARALQAAYFKEYGEFLPLEHLIVVPDSTTINSDCTCIFHYSQIVRVVKSKNENMDSRLNVYDVSAKLRKVLKDYDEISNLQ